MTDIKILQANELFANVDDESLTTIAASGSARELQRGDILFSQGDEADHIFIVTSGRIAMVNRSLDRRESVVALMEPGDLFGEIPLFDEGRRSAGARALEQSAVVSLPYEPIKALYKSQPEQLWEVVKLLVGRLRATDETLADSVFLDVTGRTAKRLLELAGDQDEFTIPVTQEELAGMIGASRERVNKAIASFVRLKWIDQTDKRYIITNREQLTIRAR